MRHLGKVSIALVVLASSACSMYSAKPAKLRPPPSVPRPKNLPAEDEKVVIKDVEECEYRWVAAPAPKASPQTAQHEREGDAKAQVYKTTADPNAKSALVIDLVDEYGRALATDPFNPDLTLKLADAYDKAYRKGCALALLGRLAKLSNNPKYATKANPVIDNAVERKDYFSRYRKEAIRAMGR